MSLFTGDIYDWSSWSKVFQSIDVWRRLIEYIFQKENLACKRIENLTPGTNAVFKVDGYVVKIFAPKESGMDTDSDYRTELFGLDRANRLGVSTPKLMASGTVQDKYQFRYMIMEHIDGVVLDAIEKDLSFEKKLMIGQKLRKVTDKLNTSCGAFNEINMPGFLLTNERNISLWSDFPIEFIHERIDYLCNLRINESEKVFCHGDLCCDNYLIDKNQELYIIDFADAIRAPVCCEHSVAAAGFSFKKPYILGYFGDFDVDEIVDLCCQGFLLSPNGQYVLKDFIGPVDEINSLKILRDKLYCLINTEKEKQIPL